MKDKRETKKWCPSPGASAASHVSETPDQRTFLAGSTPAVGLQAPPSGFGDDVIQEDYSSAEPVNTTLPLSNVSQAPQIAESAVFNNEVFDILHNYGEFVEEEEEKAPENLSSQTSSQWAPPSFISPSLRSNNRGFEDSLPLESSFVSPPSKTLNSSKVSSHADSTSIISPSRSILDEASHRMEVTESKVPKPSPSPPQQQIRAPPQRIPQTPPAEVRSPPVARESLPENLPKIIAPSPAYQRKEPVQKEVSKAAMDVSFMATQEDTQASASARKIPGPVGQLPPLKNRDQLREMEQARENEHLIRPSQAPVQTASRSSHTQKMEDQADFRNGAWLSMLCDQEMNPYGPNKLKTSLWWVKSVGWREPISSLIVSIKSLRLVEDDYRAVLRDPTGAMENCTISKAVSDKFPDFSIGCVLLLQNIAVFTPARGKSALALVPDNVVRVWPKIEMPRIELSQLSARIYTYTCIYDSIALPKNQQNGSTTAAGTQRRTALSSTQSHAVPSAAAPVLHEMPLPGPQMRGVIQNHSNALGAPSTTGASQRQVFRGTRTDTSNNLS